MALGPCPRRDPRARHCACSCVAAWRNHRIINGTHTTSEAGLSRTSSDVRFSNRPTEVKRFQTIHLCGVDVARGLALLFGLGTKALPSWDSRIRWNNLYRGLAVR